MPAYEQLIIWLGAIVVAAPGLLMVTLGLPALLKMKVAERTIARIVQAAIVSGLFAAVAVLAIMLVMGTRRVVIDFGDWVEMPRFHFSVKFVFDRLSVPFAILSFALSGTIGAFAVRYLHRERGFRRFFVLYSMFVLGM